MPRLTTYLMFMVSLMIVMFLLGQQSEGVKYVNRLVTPLPSSTTFGNSTGANLSTNSSTKFTAMNSVTNWMAENLITLAGLGALALVSLYLMGYAAIYILAALIAILLINFIFVPFDLFVCTGVDITVANACLDPLIGVPILIFLNVWGILAVFSAVKGDI